MNSLRGLLRLINRRMIIISKNFFPLEFEFSFHSLRRSVNYCCATIVLFGRNVFVVYCCDLARVWSTMLFVLLLRVMEKIVQIFVRSFWTAFRTELVENRFVWVLLQDCVRWNNLSTYERIEMFAQTEPKVSNLSLRVVKLNVKSKDTFLLTRFFSL